MLEHVFLTVSWLRHDHDGTSHLDCFASVKWPVGIEGSGLEMMATINGVSAEQWLIDHGFAEAAQLAFHDYRKMGLRARYNALEGPFIFKTDEQLDRRTALRVIMIHRKDKLYERKRKGA